LVIVAGHGATISGRLNDAGWDESVWYLLDYQKGKGLPQAIVGHIRGGIEVAAKDPKTLLVFSGGETRALVGPISEGASYFQVADAMNLFEGTVRARTTTEEYARDSFENLLFSICRFREVTGFYPHHITMVSFTFKQTRFETMHAPALRWPEDRFHYIGIDPSQRTGFNLVESTRGEDQNAAMPFLEDPYGCHTTSLREKRKGRDPFFRKHPYESTCPEIVELLRWCGPELIPEHNVPWGIKA